MTMWALARSAAAAGGRKMGSSGLSRSRSVSTIEPDAAAAKRNILPRDLHPRRQDDVVHDVERLKKDIGVRANPYDGPADGDIWYERGWLTNLAFVFFITTSIGWHKQENRFQREQERLHASSSDHPN
uniref:Uncharacterized protein n=1 Tax=Oryza punctata TaxID=4537 RepID=A0A0E0LG72_ORYPU